MGWGPGWCPVCSGVPQPHPGLSGAAHHRTGAPGGHGVPQSVCPGAPIKYNFLNPPPGGHWPLYCFYGNNLGALPVTSVSAKRGSGVGKAEPGASGCSAARGLHTQGACFPVPDRPPLPVPGLWARRPADSHIWRPGRVGHVQKGARQSLPSEGTASGALSPAWARLGAGAQLSVSPPRPPPGHTPVRVDSGDCPGARGLAGRDPRECIHSNQLSEDWVPMGPGLLSAGA